MTCDERHHGDACHDPADIGTNAERSASDEQAARLTGVEDVRARLRWAVRNWWHGPSLSHQSGAPSARNDRRCWRLARARRECTSVDGDWGTPTVDV
jgi:hypothetical protein